MKLKNLLRNKILAISLRYNINSELFNAVNEPFLIAPNNYKLNLV